MDPRPIATETINRDFEQDRQQTRSMQPQDPNFLTEKDPKTLIRGMGGEDQQKIQLSQDTGIFEAANQSDEGRDLGTSQPINFSISRASCATVITPQTPSSNRDVANRATVEWGRGDNWKAKAQQEGYVAPAESAEEESAQNRRVAFTHGQCTTSPSPPTPTFTAHEASPLTPSSSMHHSNTIDVSTVLTMFANLEQQRMQLESQRLSAESDARILQEQRDENLVRMLQTTTIRDRRLEPNSFPKTGQRWPPVGFSQRDVRVGVVPGFVLSIVDWARTGLVVAGGINPDTSASFKLTGDWFSTLVSQVRLQLRIDAVEYEALVVWLETVRDQIVMQKNANASLTDCSMWHMFVAAFHERFAGMNSNTWSSSVLEFMPMEGENIRSFTQRYYTHVKAARNAVGHDFIPDSQLQSTYFRCLEMFYLGAATALTSSLRHAQAYNGLVLTTSVPLSGGGAPIVKCDRVDTLIRYALSELTECPFRANALGKERLLRHYGAQSKGIADRPDRAKKVSGNSVDLSDDDIDCQEVRYSGGQKQVCRAFSRTGKCKFGDKCYFLHTSSSSSSSATPSTSSTYSSSVTSVTPSASSPCRGWLGGYCPYGPSCKYSHDKPCPNCEQCGHTWVWCPAGYVNRNGQLKVANDNASFMRVKKEKMESIQRQLQQANPALTISLP
jgi:hypothetical protein